MNIQLVNLCKSYQNINVLNNINLLFEDGQQYCIMGSSGVGKTTLLNILMGLVKANRGEIKGIKGRKIAAVFQEDRLIEHWNAIDNVLFVCDKTVSKELVLEEFALVDLKDFEEKPVSQLSGGMRRRIAIVRAVLGNSDLIIMDEPFKGLDKELKIKVIQYVKNKTKGKTVILVTHEKEEAKDLGAIIYQLG